MCYSAIILKKQAKSAIYGIFHDYGYIWFQKALNIIIKDLKICRWDLKAIAQNPDQTPRSLIFEGAFGCGKSTCARILAGAFLEVWFLSTS